MRRIVGDNGVFKVSSVFFLSESIVAIAPSSAEGRNTCAGRGYLLLYDFRTDKIFWRRKSDSELFHWNQRVSVLLEDAALSVDERKLAVSSAGIIYLYDFNPPLSKKREREGPVSELLDNPGSEALTGYEGFCYHNASFFASSPQCENKKA